VKKKVTVLTFSATHSALCFVGAMLLALSFPAEAQPKKVPRIGILSPGAAVGISTHSDKVFASSAMSKDKTSPLSTDGRREMKTGFRLLRLNCYASTLI
jgi:hypothetical protein